MSAAHGYCVGLTTPASLAGVLHTANYPRQFGGGLRGIMRVLRRKR